MKKILSLSVAIVMTLSAALNVFAAETVGDYDSLKTIVKAGKDALLDEDLSITSQLSLASGTSEFTVDGNGHNLTLDSSYATNSAAAVCHTTSGSAKVTFKNITFDGAGLTKKEVCLWLARGGTWNFDNVTIKNWNDTSGKDRGAIALGANGTAGGTLNMYSGSITGNHAGMTLTSAIDEVNIYGGEISGNDSADIYLKTGTINFADDENCTAKTVGTLEMSAGTVNIEGNTTVESIIKNGGEINIVGEITSDNGIVIDLPSYTEGEVVANIASQELAENAEAKVKSANDGYVFTVEDNMLKVAKAEDGVDVTVVYRDGEKIVYESSVQSVKLGTVLNLPKKSNFYKDGKIYSLPEISREVSSAGEIEVEAVIEQEYAANDIEYYEGGKAATTNANYVQATACSTKDSGNIAPSVDADGVKTYVKTSDFGNTRYFTLNFDDEIKNSVDDNSSAILNLTMTYYKAAGADSAFSKGAVRFAAVAGDYIIYSNEYNATQNTTTNIQYNLIFDVTEAVKNGETSFAIKTPAGGMQSPTLAATEYGKVYEGLAPYIEIREGNTVEIKNAQEKLITKNGSEMHSGSFTASEDDTVRIYTQDYSIVALDVNGNMVKFEDGEASFTVTGDTKAVGCTLGVSLVNGTQVRVGQGVDNEKKIKNDSGLRFIATVDRTSPLVSDENAKPGIRITAEGNENKYIDIDAAKYQDDDSVFTVAIVNLNESNYNRLFTAIPYVKLGDEQYFGTESVSRSIYEVAAGILVSNTQDAEDIDTYVINSAVKDVLNAYVNTVGIRLVLSKEDGISSVKAVDETDKGAYVGGKGTADIFFEAETISVENNVCEVKITPLGDAEIFDYWDEYIRLNNVKVGSVSSMTRNDDGSINVTINLNELAK